MKKTVGVDSIQKEIEGLTTEEQLELMERLARNLRQTRRGPKKELDWSEIYGIAKGLWKGEDAQDYVNRLREDRK